jgi:hypothetical protein
MMTSTSVLLALNMHGTFRGRNIQWVVFESTRIPETIQPAIQGADQVWVPSAWGRSVLITMASALIAYASYPKEWMATGSMLTDADPGDHAFRFLTVGKYEQSKGIDETIEAFAQVYANSPG